MTCNRSMPPAVMIPELAYAEVRTAVEWLCWTLGFGGRLRIGNHRAQPVLDGAPVIVTPFAGSLSPPHVGHAIMVRIADVNSHYADTRECGAQISGAAADFPRGEGQNYVEDIGGHRWTFSQSIADVAPSDWGGTWFDIT